MADDNCDSTTSSTDGITSGKKTIENYKNNGNNDIGIGGSSNGGSSVKTIGINNSTYPDSELQILKEEIKYYKNHMMEENIDSQNKNDRFLLPTENKIKLSSLSLDEYDNHDGNMSLISEYTQGVTGIGGTAAVPYDNNTVVSNYTISSHATISASRRRRQRKIVAMAAAASPTTRNRIIHQNENTTPSSLKSSARQQVKTGSVSFICDILHDTYGLTNQHQYEQSGRDCFDYLAAKS
jgi:hypothetical protein